MWKRVVHQQSTKKKKCWGGTRMTLMESSQPDLFVPPRPAPPSSAAVAAASSLQGHHQHPDHRVRVVDEEFGREVTVHGAEIERVQYGQQEGREQGMECAPSGERGTVHSALLLDGNGLMNDDEDGASQGIERFEYLPLVEDEGFHQFGQVASVLGAGTDNVTVATDGESLCMQEEEAWIAQGIDTANYALGNDEDSLFEAAIREIIDNSQAAGYVHVAEVEEEVEGMDDDQQLGTAPQTSDSLLYPIEVEGVSGHEPVVGLPQDAGTSDFCVGGEVASVSDQAIFAPEGTQFGQAVDEGIDSLHVANGATISQNSLYAPSHVTDFIHTAEDVSDSLQVASWPMIVEQEYSAPEDAAFVLEPSFSQQVASASQQIPDNGILPFEQEGNLQNDHESFSEKSKDNANPLHGGKRKRDEIGDGADVVDTSPKHEEESNVGINDQDERGTSATPPLSTDEFVATGLQLLPTNVEPASASSGCKATILAGAAPGTAKQHLGNGSRVSSVARSHTNAKGPENFFGDDKSGDEDQKEGGGGGSLWVKWRGKWEGAIRCSIIDCPSATLKAKPNYSKKKHVVVYFPSVRLFSWVDTQHTCPITENPLPLLSGTHSNGRDAVKDTNLPRRRMLLKLGGEMLDISDRLHIKAVVKSSQDVNVWKAFANEAAAATNYAELGILLVRLHLTIAVMYIKSGWMERRHGHWKEDCAKAASAASLQKLTKELINAVLWEDVAPLWNAAEQPELDPEWEHWKGEAFEEKDTEDDAARKGGIATAPQNGTPQGRQISVASGSKRFKEQARARRQTKVSFDTPESSQQKRSKVNSSSSEFPGGQVSSGFGLATTAFRSPLVHLSPLWQDKKANASGGRLACNSGLCSAFLKKKNRRCNRQAKEEITYCGKHKHLAYGANAGTESTSEGVLAWESGLCSASMGQELTRCVHSNNEGSIFCQIHVHLATDQIADKSGEVVCSALLKEARCNGITARGVQCTHKPKEGSPFCVKHSTQTTNDEDNNEGETQNVLRWSEGSATKRARVPQIDSQNKSERNTGSPVQIQVGQAGNGNVILGALANGMMQRSATKSSEVRSSAKDGFRKRKWVSSFFKEDSDEAEKSLLSPKQETVLPKVSEGRANSWTRCKGRTARNDEQCGSRARAGYSLCTKHWIAIEGQKKIDADDSKVSAVSGAKHLFERYLKAAEGISPGPHGLASKKQLLKWTRAESAQDYHITEELLKLVTAEMSKLQTILPPGEAVDKKDIVLKSNLPTVGNGSAQFLHIPEIAKAVEDPMSITCGLCDVAFIAKEDIGRHWQDCHKKEAGIFVKGYACKVCSRLYSRKHTVRRHWKKRHQSVPTRSPDWSAVCSICERQFEDHDDLLDHVCSEHPDKLTSPTLKNTLLNKIGTPVALEVAETLECADCHEEFKTHWDLFHHRERSHNYLETEVNGARIGTGQTKLGEVNDLDSQSVPELFECHICGKKFSFLSDLGRHKEAEHPVTNRSGRPQVEPTGKSPVNSESCRLKLPVRRKSDETVAGSEQTLGGPRSKKKGRFLKQSEKKSSEKDLEIEKQPLLLRMKVAVQTARTAQLRSLRQSKRGEVRVARPRKALYSLTKGGQMLPFHGASKYEKSPIDSKLLDMAQSACCQSQLLATLHQNYAELPDQLFVRVSKMCTEANIKLEWLAEGYLCGNGCKELSMAKGTAHRLVVCDPLVAVKADATKLSEKGVDEAGRYRSNSEHLGSKSNAVILCTDLSNGQEPVPVVCFVDQDVVDSWQRTHKDGSSSSETFKPWETFNYITKRVLDPSLGLDPENYKVGCSCKEGQCLPESCDHVDIFDNDNLDALDIYGKPMKGRFPYDEKGCILLEEGYLVYECNSSCHCQHTCPNRVLQKGVTVKLEVFRTLQKGWAVRAAQMIPRGTFVCEYLGEVLHDQEANKRGERYDQVGCSYLYDIDAHLDTTGRVGRSKPFVIDATKQGNVARFINHSCAPNLINYQVLVDSMDCQLAHIGLFASRDVSTTVVTLHLSCQAFIQPPLDRSHFNCEECAHDVDAMIKSGEELAYDYRYRLLPGRGCPCHCGAEDCRGRLY